MKLFEIPKLEIFKFEVEDIITASGTGQEDTDDDIETPEVDI